MIDLSTSPLPIFLFSSNNREYCFNVTITNDNRLEANEMFTVLAREDPPIYSDLASFVIQRDTVNITVEDNDGKLSFLCVHAYVHVRIIIGTYI